MARRSIHYEAAFEDYLRSKALPYIAVDEAKKVVFAAASIKSFDFLVSSSSGSNLLIEVKGRKFPDAAGSRRQRAPRAWENWVTRGDIEALAEWMRVFGDGFRAVLVFAYWLQGPPQRAPFADVHLFRRKYYGFVAIGLADYVAAARPRSSRWQTVAVPSAAFAAAAVDVAAML
ncbi:MAG: HYExAFE family protein [Planctomycetes bacterium]|nr:HYExAFE family protein [Planctomycetota bacterium]